MGFAIACSWYLKGSAGTVDLTENMKNRLDTRDEHGGEFNPHHTHQQVDPRGTAHDG